MNRRLVWAALIGFAIYGTVACRNATNTPTESAAELLEATDRLALTLVRKKITLRQVRTS